MVQGMEPGNLGNSPSFRRGGSFPSRLLEDAEDLGTSGPRKKQFLGKSVESLWLFFMDWCGKT